MSADDALQAKLSLICPYCGATNATSSDPHHSAAQPHQIETMPYTRSKGEFEDAPGWSQIGLDFFAELANWESIGILRVAEGDTELDVSYQLINCAECDHYFDVYLNWTPERDFADFWPHLFERDDERTAGDQIKRLDRLAWTFGTLERLDKRIRGSFWFTALLVVLVLLTLSFVPRLIIAYDRHPSSVLHEFWDISSIALITRLIGGLTLVFLLNHTYTYLTTLRTTDTFYDLFRVQKPEHVTHWLNYTLCRISGVQPADGKYALTQASVLAGYPSAAILLITWLSAQLNTTGGTWSLPVNWLVLGLLVIAGYLIGGSADLRPNPARRVFSTHWFAQHPTQLEQTSLAARVIRAAVRGVDWLVPITRSRLRGLVWGLTAWVIFVLAQVISAEPSNWEWVIDGVFEVTFWLVIAYYVGIHIYLAFNLSIYVLFQFGRLPLNVHPLRGFDDLVPVKLLTNISSQILIAILLLVLLLTGLQILPWEQMGLPLPGAQIIENTIWLSDWFTVGLLVMFFGLSLLVIRWIPTTILIGGAVAFFGGLLLSNAWVDSLPVCTDPITETCRSTQAGFDLNIVKFLFNDSPITVWPSLIVVGIALYLGITYISLIQDQYKQVLEHLKTPDIERYNQRIEELSAALLDDSRSPEELPLMQLIEVRDYLANLSVDDENTMLRLLIARAVTIAFSLGPPSLQIFGQMLGL